MQGDKYEAIWQDVWNRVKTYDDIDASQVDAFFSRIQLQAFAEGFVMITADTPFIKHWFEENYISFIKKALREAYSTDFVVAIEVDETSSTPMPSTSQANGSKAESNPSQTKQCKTVNPTPVQSTQTDVEKQQENIEQTKKAKGLGRPNSFTSGYSFETFVQGTSNRMAYSMALAVAEAPGTAELNPLFIYGRSGLGKTHLLRSIQNYIDANYEDKTTLYVDAMELVNDYTNAAASGKIEAFDAFKKRYENIDVLLIDDVQGLQNKKETLNMVFQILNRMVDEGRQVVLSADRAPRNIDMDERYQSRFNMGGTCDVQPPEFETKLGIIRNYIEECKKNPSINFDFEISEGIQSYIAQNSSSNIRELKSAITKVIFEICSNGDERMTENDLRVLLSNHFSGGAMHKPTVGGIQKAVCEYYNVSQADLVGKKRSANITEARQVGIYLCRTLIDIPLKTVGSEFNRDHSTAHYSMNVVEEKLKKSREFNEAMEILRQMILEG